MSYTRSIERHHNKRPTVEETTANRNTGSEAGQR
jgi:hypothetical protein